MFSHFFIGHTLKTYKKRKWSYHDTPMLIEHIQSAILHCDFTMFSSSFTCTFRSLYKNESLQSVKNRNSYYYQISKLLIEAVHSYGDEPHEVSYCGITMVSNVPNSMIH